MYKSNSGLGFNPNRLHLIKYLVNRKQVRFNELLLLYSNVSYN